MFQAQNELQQISRFNLFFKRVLSVKLCLEHISYICVHIQSILTTPMLLLLSAVPQLG